jgi:hypothetical protein
MGFNLGKWLYIIDAYDDIGDDIRKNNFNPLIIEGMDDKSIKEKQRERVREYMFRCLDETSAAYELLDIKHNAGILDNIIYAGLLKKTNERCEIDEEPIRGARNKRKCD